MPLVRLFGERLLPAAGKVAIPTAEALAGASTIGLYFSASWCQPCRGFTPQLKEAYPGLTQRGLKCVLVSSDRDEASFNGYFGEMPWLALPWTDRARQAALSAHFAVKTIPTLAFVDLEGRLITDKARDEVVGDPEGLKFPWAEPPVVDFASGNPGRVNQAPSLILLCEGAAPALQHQGFEALREVAEGADRPVPPDRPVVLGDDENPLSFSFGPTQGFCFFTATGGPLAEKVRELAQLPPAVPGAPPQLLLMDIPDNGGFYLGPQGEEAATEGAVREFLERYVAGGLERKQLA